MAEALATLFNTLFLGAKPIDNGPCTRRCVVCNEDFDDTKDNDKYLYHCSTCSRHTYAYTSATSCVKCKPITNTYTPLTVCWQCQNSPVKDSAGLCTMCDAGAAYTTGSM